MRGEREQAAVLGGFLKDPRSGHAQAGLDRVADPLRLFAKIRPGVVPHHVTRYRRIAATPPNPRRRSWPSSESFEMSSTEGPMPSAGAPGAAINARCPAPGSAPPSLRP